MSNPAAFSVALNGDLKSASFTKNRIGDYQGRPPCSPVACEDTRLLPGVYHRAPSARRPPRPAQRPKPNTPNVPGDRARVGRDALQRMRAATAWDYPIGSDPCQALPQLQGRRAEERRSRGAEEQGSRREGGRGAPTEKVGCALVHVIWRGKNTPPTRWSSALVHVIWKGKNAPPHLME
jgi:hypothetical protein